MIIQKAFVFTSGASNGSRLGSYDEPTECPICGYAIKPQTLSYGTFYDDNSSWFLSITYLCRHCFRTFTSLYSCRFYKDSSRSERYSSELLYTGPHGSKTQDFDEQIVNLSPQFCEIFNQSLEAEARGLNKISGVGFRKALEVLIKDFLIAETPCDEANIKDEFLGKCIKERISDQNLKLVAERAAWLGNDHSHYVQRFEDKDIDNLKRLVTLSVHWVSMLLETREALETMPQQTKT